MKPVKLELRLKRGLSRRNDPEANEADEQFAAVHGKIIQRDRHRCQGCGFVSRRTEDRPSGYLEVHHLDDNHHNNSPKNLTTLCPFCHSTFTLGRRGELFYGKLIFFPEWSQADINLLCHVIFGLDRLVQNEKYWAKPGTETDRMNLERIATDFSGVYRHLLQDGQTRLKKVVMYLEKEVLKHSTPVRDKHSGQARNPFCVALDSPNFMEIFSSTLIGLDWETKRYIESQFLVHCRLVPDPDRFDKELAFWSENIWSKVSPSDWGVTIQSFKERLASRLPVDGARAEVSFVEDAEQT